MSLAPDCCLPRFALSLRTRSCCNGKHQIQVLQQQFEFTKRIESIRKKKKRYRDACPRKKYASKRYCLNGCLGVCFLFVSLSQHQDQSYQKLEWLYKECRLLHFGEDNFHNTIGFFVVLKLVFWCHSNALIHLQRQSDYVGHVQVRLLSLYTVFTSLCMHGGMMPFKYCTLESHLSGPWCCLHALTKG